ncbi:MAG: M42 family metallopeptidase [Candidatus Bathyarchaeia archaeon]|nr:M42 family metallopeptidase [Candidatus Bathyarchaeota archaeon]
MSLMERLERLTLAHGPPGQEDEVRDLIAREVLETADEVLVDRMGNLIAVRRGEEGPRVMLCAHMDEVGFVVKHIDEEGWVWFEAHGGINERLLQGQRVSILTDKGRVDGVVGAKGRHLITEEEASRLTPMREMWIDVGARSRSEAEELGVRVGDLGTFEKRFSRLARGDLVCATSIDDRAGCLALIEALKRLGEQEATVFAVFSVQEEVGCRGAMTAAFRLDPDVALIVDTTYGLDPATTPKETRLRIGEGPSIRALERSRASMMGHVVNRRIFRRLVETAEEEGIPHQMEVTAMAVTDAATVHLSRAGIPTGEVLIPRRYSHSPIEVASLRDIENASKLISSFIDRIDSKLIGGLERKLK